MNKRQKAAEEKRQPNQPAKIGRKILIVGASEHDIAVLLRHLALEIEEGNNYMNASDMYGLRLMRPLKEGENDFYLSAGDLP